MPRKEIAEQLKLFPEEVPLTDLSPSVIVPSTIFPRKFDERTEKISNLNRSMREFRLDQSCQLSLTFDPKYSKLRMFCSPEEIEEKIQEAIFATPSMAGKLAYIKQALEEKRSELKKLNLKESLTINIPIVAINGFDQNFQIKTKEIGITLELEVSRYSEIAFHISCRFF